ncbi:HK97 gp10 family phage protein [Ruminococcus flavefaciens]|uniref:HK97 gp10 family phage protein n=1 Tax=Ruminococcus flavefaciens TaxID=1265 RepID=UPI00156663FE|nr:HK97 gp10 family phage protein [Ruminococcus flavefaciens]
MAKGHNQLIATPVALVAAMVSACQEYTDEVREAVEEGIIEIGQEAVEQIKVLAPAYEGSNKNTPKGAYRRSWKYRVDRQRGRIEVTVHAKSPHYRLTHLLENGHLNRDGTTRSKAIPHVSIVNSLAQKKVDKLLEEL